MKRAISIVLVIATIQGTGIALGAMPIVDGPDSILSSASLIVVREHYFDIQDLSELGLLDSAGPVDQFAPRPPPPGASDQINVQSLFVRIGWADGVTDITATLTFSPGVSILGVVADVEGRSGWIWGSHPNEMPWHSQLVKAGGIFGVGLDCGNLLIRGLEVQGRDPYEYDGFWVDRQSNSVTVSGTARFGKADDLRIIISYDDETATGEYFDAVVSEGNGLCVGAAFLGDGQVFYGIPLVAATAELDIKPSSCPNPLNRRSQGKLPVALLGTAEFDVSTIDLDTLRLSRADGIGGSVTPLEGPPGCHSVFEDVGTPLGGELCECHGVTGDGVVDLLMKFSTPDVVEKLELNDLESRQSVELLVSGQLQDGSPFEASDCVWIVADRKREPPPVWLARHAWRMQSDARNSLGLSSPMILRGAWATGMLTTGFGKSACLLPDRVVRILLSNWRPPYWPGTILRMTVGW